MNLVNDAVVTRSDPPFARATDELDRFGRPWLACQEVNRCLNSTSDLRIELAQFPFSGWCDLHRVGQTRPRSAFTCSQGVGSLFVRRISSRDSAARQEDRLVLGANAVDDRCELVACIRDADGDCGLHASSMYIHSLDVQEFFNCTTGPR